MTSEANGATLRDLVKKFIPESISKEIEKKCKCIFPIKDVFIRKCKVLKKPKFDITKLMELHEKSAEGGKKTKLTKQKQESHKSIYKLYIYIYIYINIICFY